jgi:hypothetical protein
MPAGEIRMARTTFDRTANRRLFLKFLAAGPLMGGAADVLAQEQRLPDPSVWGTRTLDKLIASPREASADVMIDRCSEPS